MAAKSRSMSPEGFTSIPAIMRVMAASFSAANAACGESADALRTMSEAATVAIAVTANVMARGMSVGSECGMAVQKMALSVGVDDALRNLFQALIAISLASQDALLRDMASRQAPTRTSSLREE